MSFTNDELTVSTLNPISDGQVWIPNRTLAPVMVNPSELNKVRAIITVPKTKPSKPKDTSGKGGVPMKLIGLAATESPTKTEGQQDRTFSQVSVSWTRNTNDPNFEGVAIWFKGYKNSANPVLMATASESPCTFLCETTKQHVTVIGQPYSPDGKTTPIQFCLTTTVYLDGVISAPPAPSIAQSLVGTPTGYQFSFNQVDLGDSTMDVIDSYRIYRNTSNTPSTAALIYTFKSDPTALGAITFTDHINDAPGTFYFYWVTAVNTSKLESTKTAAQSTDVIGSIGSIPPTLNTPFRSTLTTTTVTWKTSPSTFFTRADGNKTMIGQTSQAVTGLRTGAEYWFFPCWNECTQSLKWIGSADVTIPSITGVTFAAASSQYVDTTTSAPISAPTSFEIWMKGNSSGAIASYGSVLQICVTAGGEIEFGINNGVSWDTVTTAGAGIFDGAWHHIVCTYDGVNTMVVWVDSANTSDGVTLWTNPAASVIAATAGKWQIGFASGQTGAPLTSATYNSFTMSHAAVYDAAIDVNQVGSHFQAFVNISETIYESEVAYDVAANFWELDETSGTVAADTAGSNTGTYKNGPLLNQTSPVITVEGSPGIAWPFAPIIAVQAQALRNRIPLSADNMTAKTTGSGTSSGSGGGSGSGYHGGIGGSRGCFTGSTLIKTSRGNIPIKDIQPGDFVLTAKGTWRPVICLVEHPAEPRTMHNLPAASEGLSTYSHQILKDGHWIRAGEVYQSTIDVNEPVYTLSVSSREPEALAGC